MLIAIPSKSRPYKSKSKELLKNGVLFVPNCEMEQYLKFYDKNQVIGVPDDIKGITKTRNWILKNSNERYVVFVDDDLKNCGYWYSENGKRKLKKITNGEEVENEFQKLFEITEELELKIWGLKTEGSKLSQHDEKPFIFLTYITASCMGIINDGELYFDERFKVKEDYEIGLRAIEKYGGVLGCRYFHWENEHWKTEGGCADYRDDGMEKEAIMMLKDMYPKYVRMANRKNSKYCIKLNF